MDLYSAPVTVGNTKEVSHGPFFQTLGTTRRHAIKKELANMVGCGGHSLLMERYLRTTTCVRR